MWQHWPWNLKLIAVSIELVYVFGSIRLSRFPFHSNIEFIEWSPTYFLQATPVDMIISWKGSSYRWVLYEYAISILQYSAMYWEVSYSSSLQWIWLSQCCQVICQTTEEKLARSKVISQTTRWKRCVQHIYPAINIAIRWLTLTLVNYFMDSWNLFREYNIL